MALLAAAGARTGPTVREGRSLLSFPCPGGKRLFPAHFVSCLSQAQGHHLGTARPTLESVPQLAPSPSQHQLLHAELLSTGPALTDTARLCSGKLLSPLIINRDTRLISHVPQCGTSSGAAAEGQWGRGERRGQDFRGNLNKYQAMRELPAHSLCKEEGEERDFDHLHLQRTLHCGGLSVPWITKAVPHVRTVPPCPL